MSMELDFKDFEKGFKKIIEDKVPNQAADGLYRAENELLHDAIYQMPYAPFDKGDLRASARAEKPTISKDSISGRCGFNIKYAAKWHELPPEKARKINWTLPGSGPKYLESKMIRNKEKYMSIVARFIEKVLKGK